MSREITIRMYDAGFGDSFLLWFPGPDGKRHTKVLVDCGTFAKGKNALRDVCNSIVAAATDSDGVARLDVLIATHRHKDHVEGFRYPEWENVEVKEVWMPWTEHPDDEDARRVRMAQERAAAQFAQALDAQRTIAAAARDILSLALKNEAAMQTLWNGFANRPDHKYLPPKGDLPYTFRSEALPGVTVHVLGPSRDEDVIRNMEPPKEEKYLAVAGAAGSGDMLRPFSAEVRSYVPAQFARLLYARHLALRAHERIAVDHSNQQADPLAIAAEMDKVINGTSLMLVFETGKACLLFPGDAEWGTWQMVLDNRKSRELLQQVGFYKVSHHASYNGTPKRFVEKVLTQNTRAMVSVRKYSKWPNVPRGPLLKALTEKCEDHLVRSDKPKKPAKGDWYTLGEDEYATYVETRIKC